LKRSVPHQGPDPIDIAVGARIRIRRRALGFSQTKLAEALGLTFQQVQKYERGSNRVSASMLVRTAQMLQTTVGALVGEDGKTPVEEDVLTHLAIPGAVEMLAAYARIKDRSVRHTAVATLEGLAPPAPTRRSHLALANAS
jgi:transcriptional regulator with XRE-family HTH domain